MLLIITTLFFACGEKEEDTGLQVKVQESEQSDK